MKSNWIKQMGLLLLFSSLLLTASSCIPLRRLGPFPPPRRVGAAQSTAANRKIHYDIPAMLGVTGLDMRVPYWEFEKTLRDAKIEFTRNDIQYAGGRFQANYNFKHEVKLPGLSGSRMAKINVMTDLEVVNMVSIGFFGYATPEAATVDYDALYKYNTGHFGPISWSDSKIGRAVSWDDKSPGIPNVSRTSVGLMEFPPGAGKRVAATVHVSYDEMHLETHPGGAADILNPRPPNFYDALGIPGLGKGFQVGLVRNHLQGIEVREQPMGMGGKAPTGADLQLSHPVNVPGLGPEPHLVDLPIAFEKGFQGIGVLINGSTESEDAAKGICRKVYDALAHAYGEPQMYSTSTVSRWDWWGGTGENRVVLHQVGGPLPRCVLELGDPYFWRWPDERSGNGIESQ